MRQLLPPSNCKLVNIASTWVGIHEPLWYLSIHTNSIRQAAETQQGLNPPFRGLRFNWREKYKNINTYISENLWSCWPVCISVCVCVTKVWQCGGSVEVLPCSRIAHIERAHKPYTANLTALVRRNALRVADVWMDQYRSHVYMAWNVPLQVNITCVCLCVFVCWQFDTMLVLFVWEGMCGRNCVHAYLCSEAVSHIS